MNIKKGDQVRIISGKDRGKSGSVLTVYPLEEKLIVEGLNLYKKKVKPKRQGQKGEVVSRPRQIDISNVMLVCRHCGKPARMGIEHKDKKVIRICKKCRGEN